MRKLGLAFVIAMVIVHLSAALFVKIDTEAASAAIVQRTPLGRVIAWSLLLYLYSPDDESDILSSTVPHDALIARCRDRANLVLFRDGLPSLVVAGVALYLFTVRRPGSAVT